MDEKSTLTEFARSFTLDGMLPSKWLQSYDAYLKWIAETTPMREHSTLVRSVMLPWLYALCFISMIGSLIGSPILRAILLVPGLSCTLLGMLYAGVRVIRHGSQFDRTPKPADWLRTKDGRIFFEQLRLTSLSGFSRLNTETEIFHDLRLWGSDLESLLHSLAQACGVASLPLGPGPFAPGAAGDWRAWRANDYAKERYKSLTVRMILDAMAQTRA